MYIRWKTRTRRDGSALAAYLVQSHRVAGQPRQHSRYLAAIRLAYHDTPAHRQVFWAQVDRRLHALGVPAAVRQALEARLAQRLPRPSATECADAAALRASFWRPGAPGAFPTRR